MILLPRINFVHTLGKRISGDYDWLDINKHVNSGSLSKNQKDKYVLQSKKG